MSVYQGKRLRSDAPEDVIVAFQRMEKIPSKWLVNEMDTESASWKTIKILLSSVTPKEIEWGSSDRGLHSLGDCYIEVFDDHVSLMSLKTNGFYYIRSNEIANLVVDGDSCTVSTESDGEFIFKGKSNFSRTSINSFKL